MVFPPVVSGSAVFLIGAALSGTGLKYWGGGVFCQENDLSRVANVLDNKFHMAPQTCQGDNGGLPWHYDLDGNVIGGCGPGDDCKRGVDLYYGDANFVGFGALVIVFIVFFECFGAPFMKNCNVVLSLMLTYLISACTTYTAPDGTEQSFVTGYFMGKTPTATFTWVETFPLGFDGALFFPLLIAYMVSTAETVGDIGASNEASGVDPNSADGLSRVQGGLLADGFNSILAGLMTTSPNTTFSQNNGVIVITGCASRAAGLACAGWLVLFGVIGKFGGFVADIPSCVLGGMSLFLFANVMISGLSVLSTIKFNRRNRIILAISLGVGVGVAAMPNWAEGGATAGGAFYAAQLKMNIGLWPEKTTCVSGTENYIHYAVDSGGRPDIKWSYPSPPPPPPPPFVSPLPMPPPSPKLPPLSPEDPPSPPTLPSSPPAATPTVVFGKNAWVTSCQWDSGKRGIRRGFILMLKTPYCIGVLLAMILNAILPSDEVDTDKDTPAAKSSTEAELTSSA